MKNIHTETKRCKNIHIQFPPETKNLDARRLSNNSARSLVSKVAPTSLP